MHSYAACENGIPIPSAHPFVRLKHSVIVSKQLKLSSTFFHLLVAPSFYLLPTDKSLLPNECHCAGTNAFATAGFLVKLHKSEPSVNWLPCIMGLLIFSWRMTIYKFLIDWLTKRWQPPRTTVKTEADSLHDSQPFRRITAIAFTLSIIIFDINHTSDKIILYATGKIYSTYICTMCFVFFH